MPAPQRIVSLLSSATEILYAIGLGDRVVAVGYECDYPSRVADKPRVTSTRLDAELDSPAIDEFVRQRVASGMPLYEIDVRQLCDLSPDLIVTQSQCEVCAVNYDQVLDLVSGRPELKSAEVIALNPQSIDEVLTDILRIGQAARVRPAAEALVETLRGRVDRIARETDQLSAPERPNVGCIEWIEPLMLSGNWTPRLIELAGGKSVLATTGVHSKQCEWNEFCRAAPDRIIVCPCGFDLVRTMKELGVLQNGAGWGNLPAVRAGHVWAVDGNAYLNRSGPRLVDSLEILAHLLHPDRFDPPLDAASRDDAWCRVG